MARLQALRLIPEYHERVWGGQRLKPTTPPTGEAWIVYEHDRIASGPLVGKTLAEVAEEYGPDLLGRHVVAMSGKRFPLLIKLLDTAEWLSVQVHPNDEQAERLEGPGHLGKTEAWHILEAEPGARVISGVLPGTGRDELERAVRRGEMSGVMQYIGVQAGDNIFTRAGTMHALGPGLLLYEVQQTSDLTYRVFDWNRPQSTGRALHIDKSLAVIDPNATGKSMRSPELGDGERAKVLSCEYFTVEILASQSKGIDLDPRGETFHAITAIEGALRVEGEGWSEDLGRFDTVIVPASAGPYRVSPRGEFRALKASVE